jgi:DNA polymerase III delta prime subunit
VLTDDQGNEHAMMVAPSIEGSSVVGPVFVTEDALRTMQQYVDHKTTVNSLVFMGPPKCSKTTMLHEVLPRLVVASNPKMSPVFVRIVFTLGTKPREAWLRIKNRLAKVARAFEIIVDVPSDANTADELDDFALDVATGLQKQGLRLWLLIDECQVLRVSWLR